MKFEIVSRWSGAVLFSIETVTLKLAVELGVKSGADLCGADLRGADLCGANLRGANLREANLCGANLRGANLCEANLCWADLFGANLRGADLCEADLYGANLREAGLGDSKFPIQILGHKHFMQTTADGKLQIGCHIHTLEQWEKNAEKIGAAENYSHLDIEIYKLHIAHIVKVSQLLWNAEKAKP